VTTFADDEAATESSQPIEAYEITAGNEIHRLTSGTRNITIGAQTFTAAPIARSAVTVPATGGSPEFEFTLPVSHAIPQRYLQQGVPPRAVLVNVLRYQSRSGETEVIWTGYVTSLAVDGNTASFRTQPRGAQMMQRRLPTITAGRQCPHILYDPQCAVARASFVVTTTVTAVGGRSIRVATMDSKPDYWAQFGEVVHVASGERMTISDHTGTDITMQLPIPGVAIGDAVEVYAGCNHLVTECRDKFANQANFGGFPNMPTQNLFSLSGFGIYTSE
jgi:uncharacterized phage protein (TIGR02218 family)